MFCPKCGNQVVDSAKFCNKCGTAMPRLYDKREEEPEIKVIGVASGAPVYYGRQVAMNPKYAQKNQFGIKIEGNKKVIIAAVFVALIIFIFYPSVENYYKKVELKTANSNAKTAMAAAEEVIGNAGTQDISWYEIMYEDNPYTIKAGKTYDASDPNSISDAGAKAVAMVLAENGGEAGYFVLIDTFVDDKERFVIQWKEEKDSDIIGQYSFEQQESDDDLHYFYYSSIDSDFVTWDAYKEKHPRWGKYYKN